MTDLRKNNPNTFYQLKNDGKVVIGMKKGLPFNKCVSIKIFIIAQNEVLFFFFLFKQLNLAW